MLAKVKEDLVIDIDAIRYIELIHPKETPDGVTGANLIIDGALIQINDPQVAVRIMDSYNWKNQNSIVNMIEDTEGYRKKINP